LAKRYQEISAKVTVAAVCDRRIPAFVGNSTAVTDRRYKKKGFCRDFYQGFSPHTKGIAFCETVRKNI
jgi:hypothetical protein